MKANNGVVSKATNFYLAKKVFQRTSQYDAAITSYLAKV